MMQKLELAQAWLLKADANLRSARALATLDEPILETACFHCQQTVENALKALLTLHDVSFDTAHTIDYLMDLCSPFEPKLERYRLRGHDLTTYALRYRQPGWPGEPNLQELTEAIKCAESIYFQMADCLFQESNSSS